MSKSWYLAAADVAWVNGAPVPEDRRVELTPAEARFDLLHGRISPEPVETGEDRPARSRQRSKPE